MPRRRIIPWSNGNFMWKASEKIVKVLTLMEQKRTQHFFATDSTTVVLKLFHWSITLIRKEIHGIYKNNKIGQKISQNPHYKFPEMVSKV